MFNGISQTKQVCMLAYGRVHYGIHAGTSKHMYTDATCIAVEVTCLRGKQRSS